ncbi:hypothetical protein [Lewinella sp. W8]|uniref:hypothetical protein n=1 Tax=Lewinella sp. W8 TaxID=2528208 RepID=UPI001067F381|nr:hypothetical protein [Lewinella sp. W8]MTB49869.1 hypothetical protein [Lewinella sp. W8]
MHIPFCEKIQTAGFIILFAFLSWTQLSAQFSLVVEGGARTNTVKMYGDGSIPFVHSESMISPTIGIRGNFNLFNSKWSSQIRLFSTVGKHHFLNTTLIYYRTNEYQDNVNYESITYDFRMKIIGTDLMAFYRLGNSFKIGAGAQVFHLKAPISQIIWGEYSFRLRDQSGSSPVYEVFDEPISQRNDMVFDESFFQVLPVIELGWQSGRWSLFGNVRLGMNEQSTAFKVREGPTFSGGVGYSLVKGK